MLFRRVHPNSSTVGKWLRQAGNARACCRTALGCLLVWSNSSSTRISRYESGVHERALSFTESLAWVLCIPAAYFYCSDEELAEIILHQADMSEAQRREL